MDDLYIDKLLVTLVGDIFPANLPYSRGLGVAALTNKSEFVERFYQKISCFFGHSDFGFANLESPLLFDDLFSINSTFAGKACFASLLKECGIKIVSVANNHILEHGESGFESTLKILEENDIAYIGVNQECLSNIYVYQKSGLKLAFVAYNAIPDYINDNQKYAVYSKECVLASISKMKELKVDYLFISIHWGEEYLHRPSLNQIKDAHDFIDAGANFIIGHHPHVVQPVEEYKNGLICYSLGNFIFDMTYTNRVRSGLVVDLCLQKEEYTYSIRQNWIENDFFPIVKEQKKVLRLLKRELSFIQSLSSNKAPWKNYASLIRRKRIRNRIIEKSVLIKNWFKFSPEVRKEYIHFYLSKILNR